MVEQLVLDVGCHSFTENALGDASEEAKKGCCEGMGQDNRPLRNVEQIQIK